MKIYASRCPSCFHFEGDARVPPNGARGISVADFKRIKKRVKSAAEHAISDLWSLYVRLPVYLPAQRKRKRSSKDREAFVKGSRCKSGRASLLSRIPRSSAMSEEKSRGKEDALTPTPSRRDARCRNEVPQLSPGSAGCAIYTVGFTCGRESASNPITGDMRSGFQWRGNRANRDAKLSRGKVNTPLPKISGTSRGRRPRVPPSKCSNSNSFGHLATSSAIPSRWKMYKLRNIAQVDQDRTLCLLIVTELIFPSGALRLIHESFRELQVSFGSSALQLQVVAVTTLEAFPNFPSLNALPATSPWKFPSPRSMFPANVTVEPVVVQAGGGGGHSCLYATSYCAPSHYATC